MLSIMFNQTFHKIFLNFWLKIIETQRNARYKQYQERLGYSEFKHFLIPHEEFLILLGKYRRNIERRHLTMKRKPHVTQTNTLFYNLCLLSFALREQCICLCYGFHFVIMRRINNIKAYHEFCSIKFHYK
jgi:hypothetical protein